MERCFACKKRIWLWQKTGFNSSWHEKCTYIWTKGYDAALRFCANENRIHHLPTPIQLSNRRGSVGELLPKELWRGNQTVGVTE